MQPTDTAVVFIDPQNDVLSEKGANWGAVGASVTQNRTVENMERIFRAAKANGYQVFISPHYFCPTDTGCRHHPPRVGPRGKATGSGSHELTRREWRRCFVDDQREVRS